MRAGKSGLIAVARNENNASCGPFGSAEPVARSDPCDPAAATARIIAAREAFCGQARHRSIPPPRSDFNSSLFKTLDYDPVRNFTPVAMLAEYPFAVVVSKSLPVHSIQELIALAKAKPGEINYASAGNGTGQHLSTELFKLTTGVNMTHVPYRGAAPAYTDVIPGQVPVFFDNLSSALGQIKAGTVRAIAVTSRERSPLLPDVPTIAESGVPGCEYYVWFGLWAPKKTPAPTVAKLDGEEQKALADGTVQDRIATGVPSKMPLNDIEPFVKAEIAKWADVAKRANITVQ